MNRFGRSGLAGFCVLILALSAAAVVSSAAKAPPTDEELAVQNATRDALMAALQPFHWNMGDFSNGKLDEPGVASEMKTAVNARLLTVMTTKEAARWRQAVGQAIDIQAGGGNYLDLDGGVKEMTFVETTIDGDTATAVGEIKTWMNSANPDTLDVEPGTGWYDFTVNLTRVDSHWLSSNTRWTPHMEPGAP